MIRPRYVLLLLAVVPFLLYAQTDQERFSLPRRVMPLEKALIKLSEAGAQLSYRPDQLPDLAVRVPGGSRSLERWLNLLLRDTELSYERGAAGYLILLDPTLHGRSFNLYGSVTDARTGERLIGGTVQLVGEGVGTYTNDYGFYTLPTPGGRHHLRVTYIGYAPLELELVLRSDSLLDLRLAQNRELPQIIVTASSSSAEAGSYLETGTQIGRAEVAQLGGPGGEDDPLQLARLLPGVTSGSDGIGGVFIRGSEAGHNLILLDGVPVYSLSHAGGLLSIFSNQAIRRIDLYKDALPARFGGRIGGVLDVHTRDGNLYENEFTLGTTLLSTQVAAEGPIQEGESSFLLTGRYFWAGKLLRQYSQTYKAKRGKSGFADYTVYDLNLKVNQRAGKRGRIYLSVYSGLDDYANLSFQRDTLDPLTIGETVFTYSEVTARREVTKWGTTVAALRYNHVFNDRTFGNFRLSYSSLATESAFERFDSLAEAKDRDEYGEIYSGHYVSDIRQLGLAFDGQYTMGANSILRFGVEAATHRFDPRLASGKVALQTFAEVQESMPDTVHHPLQLVTYGSQEGRYGKVYYRLGLRASLWRNGGTGQFSLSPRLLFAGPLNATADWQLSYDRSVQPVHLLNSFIIGKPSDLWVPATKNLAPATAQQFSSKLKQRLSADWSLEASLYYKRLRKLVAYSEGAQTSMSWSDNLSMGCGRAYGLETLVQRSRGKLRGWFSYTLARSERTFGREINQGRTFPFRYDRRHALNLLLIYQLGERTTLTGSWRYETGLAYSLSTELVENFTDPTGPDLPLTEERNGYRLKPNHRVDLNLHTVLPGKQGRFTHAIDVGLYNAYDRHNPVYYETRKDWSVQNNQLESDQKYLQVFVAPLLPALSYQLTFSSGGGRGFGR